MNMKNNENLKGNIYGSWMIEKYFWVIQNQNVNMYLLLGEEKAMLIDTAYGKGDLSAYIKTITNLPLMVVNTHTHYDHSSGNAFFKEVWMSKKGVDDALAVKMRKKLPYPDYKINYLNDGDIIDLGNRKIEVIEIAAHHQSSYAFLDYNSKSLFTGDEIESAQVLLNLRQEDLSTKTIVENHLNNMHKLNYLSHNYLLNEL